MEYVTIRQDDEVLIVICNDEVIDEVIEAKENLPKFGNIHTLNDALRNIKGVEVHYVDYKLDLNRQDY